MYSYCAPAVNISEEAFVSKYAAIFTGIGVTEVDVTKIDGPDENGVYKFSATYKTKEYGDMSSDFTLRAGFKNKKCVVLWDYDLIFPDMEEGSTVQVQTLRAHRGEIFASDGSALAKNSFADTVYMEPGKITDIDAVAAAVSPVTGLTKKKIIEMFNNAVQKGTNIVALGAFLPGTLTERQRQSILSVKGLSIDDEQFTPIRSYPLAEKAAHIVGYTGYVDKDSIPKGYSASDRIGKTGLESAYESVLRGRDGKIVFVRDKWGKNVRTLFEEPCVEGEDLRLTIDAGLQQKAYDSLKEHLKQGQSGVAIVMDAKTGFVQAMASYPSYDDNIFNLPVPEETMAALNAPESLKPFLFRATQEYYPPGSAIKPFTAAAALEAGAVTPETVFDGKITDDQWLPDEPGWHWKPITRKDGAAGTPLKLSNALIHSDNIYFAFAAMRLGDKALTEYFSRIGFGEAVPFDLPVEKSNLVNADRRMDRRLLADMGYGQGQLLITPIQLAAMYTALANGTGDMMRPALVQKFCRTDGLKYDTLSETKPEVWKKGAVAKRTLNILTPLLEDVVNKGTAKQAKIPGVRIAGKTGTAEIGSEKSREISWFAGYWLDGYYDRLVVVMADVAANQGSVKFEIAKDLLTP